MRVALVAVVDNPHPVNCFTPRKGTESVDRGRYRRGESFVVCGLGGSWLQLRSVSRSVGWSLSTVPALLLSLLGFCLGLEPG